MKTVLFQLVSDHIGVIKLNRPEAANALSSQLLDDLSDVLNEAEGNTEIRVIIITGAGEKAFCSGSDMKERKEMSESETVKTVLATRNIINRIEKLKVPTIAAINGAAYGAGLEIALASDIRVAARMCKIGFTETSLGILPVGGGTQRLARLIGSGQAKKMIYTAKPVTANQAHLLGLVEVIAEDKPVIEEAMILAESIASNAPIAVQAAKRAIDEGFIAGFETGLNAEAQFYEQTIRTEDRLEGLKAFEEKRKPKFKGK